MAPINGIKLGFKFEDLAKSQGKKLTNIKLKNNAEMNILSNSNAYDIYLVKNKRLIGATGCRGNSQTLATFIESMMIKIAKNFEI